MTTVKQLSASPAKVYTSRANRGVTLVMAPIATNNIQKNNQKEIPKDFEDVECIKGE